MDERSFPAPWHFEEIPEGYRVLDANDRVLAYVVASDQPAEDRHTRPRVHHRMCRMDRAGSCFIPLPEGAQNTVDPRGFRIVGTVSFLTSDDAAFMTGQTLNVDGGRVRS
jgi:NAD(P)-dependent dehydrogenase (short-subunit alcohol dehydrogenase family)